MSEQMHAAARLTLEHRRCRVRTYRFTKDTLGVVLVDRVGLRAARAELDYREDLVTERSDFRVPACLLGLFPGYQEEIRT